MPVTLNSTGITFSDGNSQNSEAAGFAFGGALYNTSGTYTKPANVGGLLIGAAGGDGGRTNRPNVRYIGGSAGRAVGFINGNAYASAYYQVGAAGSPIYEVTQGSRVGSGGSSYFATSGSLAGNGGQGGGGQPSFNGNGGTFAGGKDLAFGGINGANGGSDGSAGKVAIYELG